MDARQQRLSFRLLRWHAAVSAACLFLSGCYAPLRSPGVPASSLSDTFRCPIKSQADPLNLSLLSASAPKEYILGRDDVLKVDIYNLFPGRRDDPRVKAAAHGAGLYSIEVRVTGGGDVLLPLVGAVHVGGMTLPQAQQAITKTYAHGVIDEPSLTVSLFEKATTSVVVLGEVARPDVYELPKYQNDIAHAISRAGGLTDDAGLDIEVHRKVGSHRISVLPRNDVAGQHPIGPHRLPPPNGAPSDEYAPQI